MSDRNLKLFKSALALMIENEADLGPGQLRAAVGNVARTYSLKFSDQDEDELKAELGRQRARRDLARIIAGRAVAERPASPPDGLAAVPWLETLFATGGALLAGGIPDEWLGQSIEVDQRPDHGDQQGPVDALHQLRPGVGAAGLRRRRGDGLRALGFDIVHDHFFDTIRVEGPAERVQAAFTQAAREGMNLRRLADDALGVALDDGMRFIQTDKGQRTSVPGIFAAGDICGPPWQVAKAVGEGCVAGLNAADYAKKLKGRG